MNIQLELATFGMCTVGILTSLAFGQSCEPENLLQSAVTVPAGDAPQSMTSADFDNDGVTDLATADNFGDAVSVLLSNGDGTFQQPDTYSVGNAPRSIASADFDNDGNEDVAVVGGFGIGVLLNNGEGTLAPVNVVDGGNPETLVTADFTGDSIPDLAVTGFTLSDGFDFDDVAVFAGAGDGTFEAPQIESVFSGHTGLAAADLDGDDTTDLVVANDEFAGDNNGIFALIGNGDGTFSNPALITDMENVTAIESADLNADRHMDLLATSLDDEIAVLLNNGDGSFAPTSTFDVDDQPESMAIADLDGDGDPDAVSSNVEFDTISLLINNGDGSFQPSVDYSVGDNPMSVVAGDFDLDADVDLATANRASDTISVLLNKTAQSCAADFDCSLSVGVNDLLVLLAEWGPCARCIADLDDSGQVNVSDLLELLSAWGPCP